MSYVKPIHKILGFLVETLGASLLRYFGGIDCGALRRAGRSVQVSLRESEGAEMGKSWRYVHE